MHDLPTTQKQPQIPPDEFVLKLGKINKENKARTEQPRPPSLEQPYAYAGPPYGQTEPHNKLCLRVVKIKLEKYKHAIRA